MESKQTLAEKLTEWSRTASEWLNDQQWYQEARAKWDELEPQTKTYIKLGLGTFALLSVFFTLLSSVWSTHSLKTELEDKNSLVNFIRGANDEIRRLKDLMPAAGAAGSKPETAPWLSYFESSATSAGIEPSNLSLLAEKAGQSSDSAKEALIDLKVKHVNIKKLTALIKTLETGSRPIKVRNLSVEAQPDGSGYLDATLSLSGFTPTQSP